jgi:hypothetical protein
MATGSLIYRDVIASVPPGSALVYSLFGTIFGRSLVAFQIMATLLVFAHALIFRYMCNSNDLMSEKGDIPAFVYIICSVVCYDFMSLSPCLISLTFILIAFDRIFKHIRKENNESEIFATGFYLGIAYLCFAPTVIYIVMAYLAFLLYTRTSFRYYMLLLTGFIFPTLCVLTFFFYFDGLIEFLNYYIYNFPVRPDFSFDIDAGNIAIITWPILLLTILGFIVTARYKRFINYQSICQQMMFMLLVATLGVIILFFSHTLTSFMLLVPFMSFFISHFLILARRKNLVSILTMFFVLNSTQVIYSYLPISIYNADILDFNKQISLPSTWNDKYQNKKIAAFGNDISIFRNNQLGTSYFDWELSSKYLEGMDYYSKVVHVYNGISRDMPDVIIDEKNVMPKVFDRIPALAKAYKKTSLAGVYEKR